MEPYTLSSFHGLHKLSVYLSTTSYRFAHAVPYTAVMFVMGFAMGFNIFRLGLNLLDESMITWMAIPGQLLLLVFLPGLLYIDAYHIDGKF